MTESLHTLKERNVKRLSYAGRLPFYYVERAVISVSAGHISISSRGAVGEVFLSPTRRRFAKSIVVKK